MAGDNNLVIPYPKEFAGKSVRMLVPNMKSKKNRRFYCWKRMSKSRKVEIICQSYICFLLSDA